MWNTFAVTSFPAILGIIFTFLVLYEGRTLIGRKAPYSFSMYVLIPLFVVAYGFFTAAGYLGYQSLDNQTFQNSFLGTFYVSILLTFAWAFVFFVCRESRVAIVLGVTLLGVLIYMIFNVWNYSVTASSLFIVYLSFCLYLIFLNVGYVSVNKI